AHAERVAWIEHQLGLGVYECRSLDAGIHLAIPHLHAAFKHTADNTFLLPGLAFADFAIRVKARQLGAGPGATGRAIVGFPGTEHEIPAVHPGKLRWTIKFDVIDLLAVCAGNAIVA